MVVLARELVDSTAVAQLVVAAWAVVEAEQRTLRERQDS